MKITDIIKCTFFAISVLITIAYWVVIIAKHHIKPNKIYGPCIVLVYLMLYLFTTDIGFVPCLSVNAVYWIIAGGMIYDELTQNTES